MLYIAVPVCNTCLIEYWLGQKININARVLFVFLVLIVFLAVDLHSFQSDFEILVAFSLVCLFIYF